MAKVMMTLRATEGAPTLEAVRARYSLTDQEIDPEFGVVEIDPDEHLYTILVEESAAPKIAGGAWRPEGPFANPRIEPFGPPGS